MTFDYLDWNKWKTLKGFFEKNHEHTPLGEIPQCFKICIWFPRHVYKDMVLFSAYVLRAIRISRWIPWKPGQSDKCPNFHIFSDPVMNACFSNKNYFFFGVSGRMGGF